MTTPFQIKGVYTFDVYPTSIIGTSFQNVTILAMMDFESALTFADINALHINVYPHLPSGTPDDPTSTDYLLIRTSSGISSIIGLSWINLDTVETVESRRATAVIENVTSADVTRIRDALVMNGFNDISITLN